MLLTFNNLAFAEDDDAYVKRCKVEYTQLYLITGKEVIYKNTSQFRFYNHCKEGLKRLSKKLYKWLDKNNTNIISKFSICIKHFINTKCIVIREIFNYI